MPSTREPSFHPFFPARIVLHLDADPARFRAPPPPPPLSRARKAYHRQSLRQRHHLVSTSSAAFQHPSASVLKSADDVRCQTPQSEQQEAPERGRLGYNKHPKRVCIKPIHGAVHPCQPFRTAVTNTNSKHPLDLQHRHARVSTFAPTRPAWRFAFFLSKTCIRAKASQSSTAYRSDNITHAANSDPFS